MRRQNSVLGVLIAVVTIVTTTLSLGLPAAVQAEESGPELIGHWTFDDAAFGSGAADSAASNTATLSGNCTVPSSSTNLPPSVESGDARSLSLDGQSCLVITNPFRAVPDGHGDISDFSICTWINTTSQGTGVNHWNSAPILDGEVGGISNDFGFGLSETGKLTFGTGRANGSHDERIDGATTVNDGRWHHVCVTRDSTKSTGNVILYVDGFRDIGTSNNGLGGSNQDAPTRSLKAHIGWGQDDYHNRFVGFMDDLRVYNGVLGDAEIGNLYSGSDDLQASADGEAPDPGDGVAASIEDAAPNGGDANADGIADRLQRNVASLPNAIDGQNTTLVMSAVAGGCALTSVTGVAAPADLGYTYQAGLTSYAADCDNGSTARITLYQYGETCSRLAVRSYDATSGTYQTIDTATIRQTTIDGTVVAVGAFEVPADGSITGTFGIAQSTSACPVSPLNPLPIITIDGAAAPDSLSDHTSTNTALSLALAATEPGPSPFTWSISSQPAFGAASTSDSVGSDVTIEYVPQSGFVGTDSFTVRLANGSGGFDYLAVELAIGPQLANVTAPEISVSGSLYVSDTLSMAASGSWNFSGTTGSGTRYQWYKIRGASRTAINGATGAELVLTPDLVGAEVVVEVTAWARFYAPASVDSDPVGPVLARDFSVVGVPTVGGTPQAGKTLTADPDLDGWSPAADGFTYQWYADGVAISGAMAAEFVVTADLVGADVFVKVTASGSGYAPASVNSDPVGPVLADTPEIGLVLDFTLGASLTNASATISAVGLQFGSQYRLTMYSTPQVIHSGTVDASGGFRRVVSLPADTPAGAHRLVLTGIAADGTEMQAEAWFSVLAGGSIGAVSYTGPVSAGLPVTGTDATATALLAGLLLLLGLVLLRVARRRA